jgi:uncharacterized protein involved in exopolysaccharide biosynthesis
MNRKMILRNGADPQSDSSDKVEAMSADPSSALSKINLMELALVLIGRRKTIFYVVAATMLLTAIVLFLIPNKYQSVATILPTGNNDQMFDLKALAGLDNLISQDDNSSELFPVILRSQAVQDPVLTREYNFVHDDDTMIVNLTDYFGQDNPDKLRMALTYATSINSDKKTGVISVAVETKYPELSQMVLGAYLYELDDFNQHKQRTRAGENARYLETQTANAKKELEDSENRLQEFESVNRDWETSGDPETIVLLGRLKREAEIKSQTYLFLCQQYEAAKLDAQKNLPVVRVLDEPTLPTVKASPMRMVILILFSMMAFFGATALVIITESFRKEKKIPGNNLEIVQNDLKLAFPRTNRLINRLRPAVQEATVPTRE